MVRGEYDQAAVIEKVMHGEEKEGHMNTNKGKSPKDNKVLVNFVEGINIGVINQITPNSGADLEKLNNVATFMGVDILIYGTSSGKSQVFEDGGMLFINPGSATGALPECEVPSFVLMDISEPRDEMEQKKDRQVVVYLYKLVDNEVTIEKIEYNKPVY
ncbi:Vacuolar protein sorting-associated protein 29 [Zancudomyces culisetae]|uniref:Vacuolar protein sorting-associated protein 29 n=1 Tax=Zancudomyces culisetae TaxID=1213189 RepID=A0A1R1PI62_ZANCU|nr:Vacuolar protein sorting-associated protein 29 [Zancudomyces culisetae]|eukprot:OMH80670.1 Vacuolar protein sorting-associated protein 29 [Zancudomyces culisetae]